MAQLAVIDGGRAPNGPAPPEHEDDRPTIRVAAGQLPRLIADAIDALVRFDANIYQRAGELVTITREPMRVETDDGDELAVLRRGRDVSLRSGTPRIRPVPVPVLVERLATVAAWEKYDGRAKDWTPCDPPTSLAASICARGDWPGVRPIAGIRETPFLAPSGRIVSTRGYDAETGFVLWPSVDVGEIPEAPTQAQARSAMRYLWTECFVDFPYRGLGESQGTREDDAAHARFGAAGACPDAFVGVSAMLTIIARGAISGAVPSVIFEAAAQGSGKTKQMHAVSLVTTGRAAGTSAYPMSRDGRTNDEEMGKTLGAYARSGVPIVAFDNVRGEIGGGAIEGAVTAEGSAPFRLLGTNDTVDLPWLALVMFSGNNAATSEDMAQRSLLSRLESERENPRLRPPADFRRPALLPWIRENRAKLVRACLVILRAFVVAENKPDVGTIGSFEAWSRLIPPAIVYAGGPNVIDAQPRDGVTDNGEAEQHSTIMRYWPSNAYPDGAKLGDVIHFAFDNEHAISRGDMEPDGLDDFRDAVRGITRTIGDRVPSASSLGNALRGLRGKWRDDLRIINELDRTKVARWRVVKRESQRALPLPDPAESFDR